MISSCLWCHGSGDLRAIRGEGHAECTAHLLGDATLPQIITGRKSDSPPQMWKLLGTEPGQLPSPAPPSLWTLSPVHLGLHPGNYGDSQLGAHYVSGTMSVIMWISQISSYPHFLFFKLNFKFYLLLTALSLRSFLWAFSSCSDYGATLLCGMWASHCGGLSCCRAWALGTWVSIQLWLTGLVAPWHVRSSQTRDRTCVPCIGRWVPIHQGSISPYPHFLEK